MGMAVSFCIWLSSKPEIVAPAICAKPIKPAASPARVGLGITAPATEPGSTIPAPSVRSTWGSIRPATLGPIS
ncbi:hypothetical protein D3C76_958540 [compost metagenome]